MPKMKTHSGAAKRFRLTGKGQVKRAQAHRRHILTKKSTKRKRHLRSDIQRIHKVDVASIKRMLPYA